MKNWKSIIAIFAAIFLFFILLVGLLYTHKLFEMKQLVLNNQQSFDIIKKPYIFDLRWKKIFIKKYDILSTLVTFLRINQNNLLTLTTQHKSLTTIGLNKVLYFQMKLLHQSVVALRYPLSPTKTSIIKDKDKRFINKTVQKSIITTLIYKSVIIQHSLSQDGKKSGLTYRMQKELQSIFGSQIDFSHDIHHGDH